ncbi:MAG: riboflavin synthase [Bacteroidetes bacterium]|nr:riboflavin synthase [Bacteroidota bacterium]
MFTGIIEEVGRTEAIKPIAGGKSLTISAEKILSGINTGDSISINGVCLTVTKFSARNFTVDAVGETLNKTTMNELKIGDNVNLEPALRLSQKLGGHIVQGHVNDVGEISELKKLGENYLLSVLVPVALEKYLIKEGSIAIDGISLTIADVDRNKCTFSIIPHTWANTNLNAKKIGNKVNIEIDIITKYVEKLLAGTKENISELDEERLNKLGY